MFVRLIFEIRQSKVWWLIYLFHTLNQTIVLLETKFIALQRKLFVFFFLLTLCSFFLYFHFILVVLFKKKHYRIAGLSFSNSALGICHSLAHVLGSKFGIAHGLANGCLISQVIRYNGSTHPFKSTPWPAYSVKLQCAHSFSFKSLKKTLVCRNAILDTQVCGNHCL